MITLRNKIAQMILIGFQGTDINEYSPVSKWLSQDGLGGVLLFDKDISNDLYGKNLKNKVQIKELVHQLQAYSFKHSHHALPLFIAVDFEGGAVDRFTKIEDCMTTLTAEALAQLSSSALDEELHEMASTLEELGFNLNFAPVVDLNLNKDQGIIGKLKRSFSNDPEIVATVAAHFVDVFSQHGIACSYKHFPGHGSAMGDTHEGFVDVTDTYNPKELLPYNRLLKDNSKPVMVMTAHVINKHLDSDGLPATLSHEILTGLLRNTLGYDGVIISDDLQMQAIAHHYSLEESLYLTIQAGADMMIFANQLGSITAPEIINCIEQLIMDHRIDPKRIDDAYRRIIRIKQHLHCAEFV